MAGTKRQEKDAVSGYVDSSYVLGHAPGELERLTRQAAFLGDLTEHVLRRAGLRPGMRVLDVGCGAGDVSLIAARMVGPQGTVLGIDRAAEPLQMARRRAEADGVHWAAFQQADHATFEADQRFDAALGRLVLVYASDPAVPLRSLLKHVVSGGIMAFQEMDMSRAATVPDIPLFGRCLAWIQATYERSGLTPDTGSRLDSAFRAVGLTPSLIGACRVEGGSEGFGYAWLAQTVRSLLPAMARLGVAAPAEVDIDTLEDRLREGARETGACLIGPLMVGAWARTPG